MNQLMDWYKDRLDQKKKSLDHFKDKSTVLKQNLENTKLFLNMVIHDLRNPTNQV